MCSGCFPKAERNMGPALESSQCITQAVGSMNKPFLPFRELFEAEGSARDQADHPNYCHRQGCV